MKFKILAALILIAGTACTEAGETTEVAAATGGVIGAGLGAIIGSQTGDPGAGLVIGAAAGAGSGALIGNSIEAQQKNIRTQDEAIERQERTIAAQRSELAELRRMNQDSPVFRRRLDDSLRNERAYNKDPRASYNSRAANSLRAPDSALREKPIQPEINSIQQGKSSYSAQIFDSPPKPQIPPPGNNLQDRIGLTSDTVAVEAAKINSNTQSSDECRQAEAEMSKAKLASDNSDKLFHTRRAIRLCSQEPSFHHSLGEIYVSLNRKDDAVYEFQEALKYDPKFMPAQVSLDRINVRQSAQSSSNALNKGSFQSADRY